MILRRRNLVIAVIAAVVLGVLIGREYPHVGSVVSLAATGLYILFSVPRLRRGIVGWGTAGRNERIGVVIAGMVCILFVEMLVTGTSGYFPILILLCADLVVS